MELGTMVDLIEENAGESVWFGKIDGTKYSYIMRRVRQWRRWQARLHLTAYSPSLRKLGNQTWDGCSEFVIERN